MTTEEGKEACDRFFERNKKEWQEDPNNIPFDFVEKIAKKSVEDPPEYNIFKRRQKTKDGEADPKSPCDDKGLPLYVDPDGNLVTKADGNKIAWGEWIDAIKNGVSIKQLNPPKRCWARSIRDIDHFYNLRDDEHVERVIEKDRKLHEQQQASRKSKVNAEYKYEKTKEKSSHDEWTCDLTKKRVRDFPFGWIDVKYNPLNVPHLYPIDIAFSRHKISEKTGKELSSTTGVGTFKGRSRIEGEIAKGKIFGMYALDAGAKNAGFTGSDDYSSRGDWEMKVPGTEDVCVISTSKRDFPFIASEFTMRRLRSPDGKIPISGYFSAADFKVVMRKGKYSKRYDYEEKAPEASVEFCHEKFNEAITDTVINKRTNW